MTTVHAPFDPRIFHREARTLAAAGWSVDLATTTSEATEVDGVRLLPLGAAGKSRLGRLPRNFRALKLMLRRYGIIHIHDPELLLAAAIARLFGHRIVYDVHEFYHTRFGQYYWMPRFLRPFVAQCYAVSERLVLPNLSGIVVVTDAMTSHYTTLVAKERVVTVRNLPAIGASEVERLRKTPRPLEERYIVHAGEASKNRMFHVTVEAAELLRKMGNPLPIINLGWIDLSGYSVSERRRLVERAKDADVRLLGKLPYEEAKTWLAHAHIGYLPLAMDPRNMEALPVKLFEYFTFGLPIVAADFGAVGRIVAEQSAGLLAAYDDPAAYAKALNEISTDSTLHQRLGERSRAAGLLFTFDKDFPKLEALYRAILLER